MEDWRVRRVSSIDSVGRLSQQSLQQTVELVTASFTNQEELPSTGRESLLLDRQQMPQRVLVGNKVLTLYVYKDWIRKRCRTVIAS